MTKSSLLRDNRGHANTFLNGMHMTVHRVTPYTDTQHDKKRISRLSAWTTDPPPLTKISSWHPKKVRRLLLDEKLDLFKASFRVYGIKHQLDGSDLYYFSYFATFSLLFQKLLVSLVKTPIC